MALVDHGGNPEPAALPRRALAQADFATRPRPFPDNDNRHAGERFEAAPELDCLRDLLPPGVLTAAARRAGAIGVSADRVLLQDGALTEEAYVALLARDLGVRFNPLTAPGADVCALDEAQLGDAAGTGIIPLRRHGELIFVIAPRHAGARGIKQLLMRRPGIAAHIELTTTGHLDRFVARHGSAAMATRAANGLHLAFPAFSAAPLRQPDRRQRAWRMLRIAGVAALVVAPPLLAGGIWTAAMAAFFLGFVALRLIGSLAAPPPSRPAPRQPDAELPVYTVIIALYREATSVAPLLQAIRALDYPGEKLDIIIVTEADDDATRNAITRLGPLPNLRVLTAPDIAPRTKPKALNYAMPFARGSLVAVFDAEDRPEPGQLRGAIVAFSRDHRIACVQAALCIDNAAESLLSRMFAAEYAVQFDLFLPGLVTLRLPLPLGGSSNHFRAALLRESGCWDAHNVTEDADLGIRLARFGYRSATFPSTTYEEAPIHLGAWLRQRTRWMKGWMQTWSVHMRDPARLWREAGARGFVTINLIVGGNVLTALAYPTLLAELVLLVARGTSGHASGLVAAMAPLHVATIAAGYLSIIGLGLAGLARRRQLRHGWILLLAPLYWGLLSITAWRALWQLWRDPTRWEKTEHGVSKRGSQ